MYQHGRSFEFVEDAQSSLRGVRFARAHWPHLCADRDFSVGARFTAKALNACRHLAFASVHGAPIAVCIISDHHATYRAIDGPRPQCNPGEWYIDLLCRGPPRAGSHRIGRDLLGFVIGVATDRGITAIRLCAAPYGGAKVRKMYETFGFVDPRTLGMGRPGDVRLSVERRRRKKKRGANLTLSKGLLTDGTACGGRRGEGRTMILVLKQRGAHLPEPPSTGSWPCAIM